MERSCYNCGQINTLPEAIERFFCVRCGAENLSAVVGTPPRSGVAGQSPAHPSPTAYSGQGPYPPSPPRKSNKGVLISSAIGALVILGLVGSALEEDPSDSPEVNTGATETSLQDTETESESDGSSGGQPDSPEASSNPSKPKKEKSGGADGARKITAPDVVGINLQSAQDTMQAAGLYNLHSYDVTGDASFQIIDRNWRVVEQSPAAGAEVGPGKYVDLGVVER